MDPIAYLRVREISASTPHELRKLAQELESQGFEALVLDLRGLSSSDLHSTVLLADTLLSHGRIGQVRLADRVMTYDATEDELFHDWPLSVLVNSETAGGAEWLAAALQDNHRAVIVGSRTKSGQPSPRAMQVVNFPGPAEIRSTIPLDDGRSFVSLITGRFERGDGRPLVTPFSRPGTAANALTGTARQADARDEAGVEPDYPIAPPSLRQGSRPPARGSMFGQDIPVEPSKDPSLLKAVEVLRGALKRV
jgi:carboxyl-terminal processing protease